MFPGYPIKYMIYSLCILLQIIFFTLHSFFSLSMLLYVILLHVFHCLYTIQLYIRSHSIHCHVDGHLDVLFPFSQKLCWDLFYITYIIQTDLFLLSQSPGSFHYDLFSIGPWLESVHFLPTVWASAVHPVIQ